MSQQGGGVSGRSAAASFSGLLGAMAVLLIVIGAFVGLRAIGRDAPETVIAPVDYLTPARAAREAVDFTVSVPDPMPAGWTATSVRLTSQGVREWHVGMLTDAKRYVALEQSDAPEADLVSTYLGADAVSGDDVTIGAMTWRSYAASNGDVGLVHTGDTGTTVVLGHVGTSALVTLITALDRL